MYVSLDKIERIPDFEMTEKPTQLSDPSPQGGTSHPQDCGASQPQENTQSESELIAKSQEIQFLKQKLLETEKRVDMLKKELEEKVNEERSDRSPPEEMDEEDQSVQFEGRHH